MIIRISNSQSQILELKEADEKANVMATYKPSRYTKSSERRPLGIAGDEVFLYGVKKDDFVFGKGVKVTEDKKADKK